MTFRVLVGFAVALTCACLVAAAPEPDVAARAERWQQRVDAYIAEDRQQPSAKGVCIFAGSSSIDGWKTLRDDFPELPMLNRGIGGFWLADLVHFAQPLVLSHQPSTVVVYAGENDIADGRSVDSVVRAFKAFDSKLRSAHPEARLVFISLKPSPSRAALMPQFAEVNRQIAEICAGLHNRTFVDVFTPMCDAAGKPRSELFGPDALHMNESGYKLWTTLLRPLLVTGRATPSASGPTLQRNP